MAGEQSKLLPPKQALILVLVASVFRLAFWLLASKSAFLQTPVVDASFFDIWARTLAEGKVFQDQAFFKPPLYPYLLSWLYQVGFQLGSVQIFQLLTGIVTSLLTLAIGRLVFSPRIALAGAVTTALLPILPFFEVQLLAESWATALSLGSLLLILLVVQKKSPIPNRLLFFSGVLMGLAALGRPNLMLLVGVMALWLWQWKNGPWKARSGPLLALLLGFLITLAPVTLFNLQHGEPALISTNLGVNLVTGNSDRADGVNAIPVGVLWDDLQLRTRQAGCRNSSEASRFLTKEAMHWVLEHPGRTLQLLGKKIILMTNAQEGRNNINPRWLAQVDGVFLLHRWWPGTWLMLPFSFLGLWLYRRWLPGSSFLVWVLLAQVVAILPFFVNARFRLPLLPILALFAAAGFSYLWELQESAAKGKLIRYLAILAVLFFGVNIDWFGLGDDRWLAQDYFNQGLIQSRGYHGRQPDLAQAEIYFRRAIELDATDVDGFERLGALLLQQVSPLLSRGFQEEAQGNLELAGRAFGSAEKSLQEASAMHQKALELFPRSYRSWANLGTCQMWQGDLRAFECRRRLDQLDQPGAREKAVQALQYYLNARTSFERGLKINPGQKSSLTSIHQLGNSLLQLPALDPTIEAIQKRIQSGSGPE